MGLLLIDPLLIESLSIKVLLIIGLSYMSASPAATLATYSEAINFQALRCQNQSDTLVQSMIGGVNLDGAQAPKIPRLMIFRSAAYFQYPKVAVETCAVRQTPRTSG